MIVECVRVLIVDGEGTQQVYSVAVTANEKVNTFVTAAAAAAGRVGLQTQSRRQTDSRC